MRKVEKYIYLILGVILVGVISTGVTYILMDKENNTEIKENDKQEESKKDNNEKLANSVKFKEIKRDNNKILESFDIILNNKKKCI